MAKYRMKPIIVDAEQWNGTFSDVVCPCTETSHKKCVHCGETMLNHGMTHSSDGIHIVCRGDWVIKGVKGLIYPRKPDIFEATYEKVSE